MKNAKQISPNHQGNLKNLLIGSIQSDWCLKLDTALNNKASSSDWRVTGRETRPLSIYISSDKNLT